MKKININVALCKDYDFNTKSVDGFLQEIIAKDNKAEVTVFSMITGIEDTNADFRYDFYLKYLEGENDKQKGAVSYLFSMVGREGEEEEYTSSYDNVYNVISALKKEISFVGKGYYELEVFECSESKYEKISSSRERYKKLVTDSFPATVYSFKVV